LEEGGEGKKFQEKLKGVSQANNKSNLISRVISATDFWTAGKEWRACMRCLAIAHAQSG
jgi:hypothetical protein